jgi:hypothetical protein
LIFSTQPQIHQSKLVKIKPLTQLTTSYQIPNWQICIAREFQKASLQSQNRTNEEQRIWNSTDLSLAKPTLEARARKIPNF